MEDHQEAMDDSLQTILFRLACRFRLGILRSKPSISSLPTLRDFPRGACADASLLLAKFLQANNCGGSHLVIGERQRHRHAWLQLHDITIDITADQFHDQDKGVIVATESAWHSAFDGQVYSVADFCLYDRHTVFTLRRAYDAITECLRGE